METMETYGKCSSLAELAERVGCTKFPQRWNDFFSETAEDFYQNGSPYVTAEYYAQLNRRYGILSKHLALYQQAAAKIAEDRDLSLFLAVLCRGLQDREYHSEDMRCFAAPKKPENPFCEMLTALAAASEADMCYELLMQKGLPPEFVEQVMHMPEWGVDGYMEKHGGRPGYSLLGWFQLAIDVKLFRIGRLEIEVLKNFSEHAVVFRDRKGNLTALASELAVHRSGRALGCAHCEDPEGSYTAQIRTEEDFWEGHAFDANGLVEPGTVRLSKSEWHPVLSPGDPVVGLHIPGGGGLTPERVDETLAQTKIFLEKYFPEYDYRAFTCGSWLMDPQLEEMLGSEANISKFGRRFRKITCKSAGTELFSFVFQKPDMNFSIADLPENTRLEKALKAHYLQGRAIYAMCGYFFPEWM